LRSIAASLLVREALSAIRAAAGANKKLSVDDLMQPVTFTSLFFETSSSLLL
jgi:hypothetical protein